MSDDTPLSTAMPQADKALQVQADAALSLRPERLAGSAECLNCGTELQGPFCYHCGQPDRNFMRFFPALLREFLEEFLDLDSRFMRTMKPLMFKPGRLTRDYLEGRRFRYTPPMRLYIFASLGFFLLAAFLSSVSLNVGVSLSPDSGTPNVRIFSDAEDEPMIDADELREKLEQADVADVDRLVQAYEQSQQTSAGPLINDKPFTAENIMIGGKPWNRETNPVIIPLMPAFIGDWINDEVGQSPEKAKRIHDNPNLFWDQIFDILPVTMFILLPVVALLFKFWYLFARRYYIEHLIYALHNHSFIFVSLILILVMVQVHGSTWASDAGIVRTLSLWLIVGLSAWIPTYLLLSLRHVYQQNWFLTLAKFSLIGISYVTLLSVFTSIVAVLGFLLL